VKQKWRISTLFVVIYEGFFLLRCLLMIYLDDFFWDAIGTHTILFIAPLCIVLPYRLYPVAARAQKLRLYWVVVQTLVILFLVVAIRTIAFEMPLPWGAVGLEGIALDRLCYARVLVCDALFLEIFAWVGRA
jgi:hypothetical protein